MGINDSGNKSTDLIISASDIHVKLSQLKTGKSPGPDQLHPRILYETRDVVLYPLFLIFNQSFKTGVYYHMTGNLQKLLQYIKRLKN